MERGNMEQIIKGYNKDGQIDMSNVDVSKIPMPRNDREAAQAILLWRGFEGTPEELEREIDNIVETRIRHRNQNRTSQKKGDKVIKPVISKPPIENPIKENKYEVSEMSFKTINFFETNQSSQEIHDKWLGQYFDNPTSFFNDQNLKKLREINPGERLILLAKASYYLTNTPEMVQKYYREFPDDLVAVINKFKILKGYANTGLEYNLFSISAEEMVRAEPGIAKNYQSIEQYLEMVDRRKLAPGILMKNFEYKFRL